MKKSWIRSLCMVLCIAFMFTFMEGVALADESGEWGNLTWKLDSKGTLMISGTGEMEKLFFSFFDDRAWHNITGQIRKVIIKPGVTSIGAYAFESCKSLISVSIPDSVTSIGDFAFSGCKSLPEITIPNSVISIGEMAFQECESLSSIIIPDSVTAIEVNTFDGCSSLKTISIPNSVNSIDDGAFAGCAKLAEIKISKDHPYFEIIDGSLFTKTDKQLIRYSPTLKENSYTIPDGTTGIGNDAFSGHKMTSITIPDSVSSIGNTAFRGCECDSFNISPNHPYFEIVDGSLISKADKVLYRYVGQSIPSNYTIPDGVTSINASAFDSIDGMKTVTIPDSVTSIGEYAFYHSDLQSITIPDSVTSIGIGAFRLCESLQSITIPDSVTSIGEGAFEGSNLKSVKLSKNITSIPALLFNISSIESVDIPDGVTSIGELAFSFCTHLQSITIPDSVTSIGVEAFELCTDLQSVTISDGVTSIGDDAFSCTIIESIIIPDSVTSIEGNPFYKCGKLTSIEISPDHPYLELIDNALFTKTDKRLICYTPALRTKEYIVPDGTTGIEDAAFLGLKELESVVIPASVTSIGSDAFSGCDKLTATVIKGSYAQQYCKENGIKTKEIKVSKVILDPVELFFYVGTDEVQTVKASLEPASVPPIGLTWIPAKKDIVEITEAEDGVVSIKPLKAGKTDITMKEPGGKSAKLKVNVVDPVESVELAVKGNAKAGGKVNITATLAPQTAGNKAVEYSLDVGEDIATINNKGQLSISKNAPSGTKITVTCTALGAPVPVTASVEVEVP